ncbi:hypothetical protein M885DRAFT_622511 [Pelagophyceae sp. CCMP2097]|nr:hypothetical protein M885DRAFT_622511 [Pelagophyceae sp. CCMP2097]
MRLRLLRVAWLASAAAWRSSCVRDAHGCCSSEGWFYCGSSGRCISTTKPHDWDECENAAAAAPTCTLEMQGVAYDLSPLRLATADYEAAIGDTTIVFNVCANAAEPAACVEPARRNATAAARRDSTAPAAAYAVHGGERCARLAASVTQAEATTLSLLDAENAAKGVRLSFGGGRGALSLALRCDAGAAAFGPLAVSRAADGGYEVAFPSVFACPAQCLDPGGAPKVCSSRGNCVLRADGAACACARGFGGRTCEALDAPLQETLSESRWPWQLFATLVTGCSVALVIARRCLALRAWRREEVDVRYRTVPSHDEHGLELHARD